MVFTAGSFIRLDIRELVDGSTFTGSSDSAFSGDITRFSIHTPVLVEEAMKILNTPRMLEQKRAQRVRRLLINPRIVSEVGTVSYFIARNQAYLKQGTGAACTKRIPDRVCRGDQADDCPVIGVARHSSRDGSERFVSEREEVGLSWHTCRWSKWNCQWFSINNRGNWKELFFTGLRYFFLFFYKLW